MFKSRYGDMLLMLLKSSPVEFLISSSLPGNRNACMHKHLAENPCYCLGLKEDLSCIICIKIKSWEEYVRLKVVLLGNKFN